MLVEVKWRNKFDLHKAKEICERYAELRKVVLNVNNFNLIVSDLQSNIEYSDFEKGIEKWGVGDSTLTTGSLSKKFENLLKMFGM